ncbi:S53 family peptidase [Thermoplasma volcanium]|nr:S8 family serine peptidase [Thermoplasma volcanium]
MNSRYYIALGIAAFLIVISFSGISLYHLRETQQNHNVNYITDLNKNYNAGYNGILIYSDNGLAEEILNSLNILYNKYGNLLIPENISNRSLSNLESVLNTVGVEYQSLPTNLSFTPYVYATPLQQGNPVVYYPAQIYKAYSYGWDIAHGINGKGETIAIIDAYGDPFLNYDLNAFDSITGLPPANISVIYLDGAGAQYNEHWAQETSLDVEWAHVSAPLAKIILVVSPNDSVLSLTAAVAYVIQNIKTSVISLSWGIAENQLPISQIELMNSMYLNATKKGITIVAASGDYGAYDNTKNLTVNFPASSPYVLGVGGTSLFLSNGIFRQSAWGGTSSQGSFGSGGGFSSFPRPYWQIAPGYNSTYRGVPDVSMIANPNTGVLMISGAKAYDAGGTSLAAPLWAGVIAMMDQYDNTTLGLVNPILYQLSNTPLYNSTFTQITTGYNGYYSAAPGWNPVTGLGTPIVSNLINASRSLLEPFGTAAIIHSPAEKIMTSVGAKNTNGTYIFAGYLLNDQNFIKFGVYSNKTSSSIVYMISYNGNTFSKVEASLKPVTSYFNFSISLYYNNGSFYGTFNQNTYDLRYFLPNYGSMLPGVGVEMIGSYDNITNLSVEFKNVTLGNFPISYFNVTQYRFSEIGSQYDSLGIGIRGNNLTVSRFISFDLYLTDVSTEPFIQYTIGYHYPYELSLSLSNNKTTQFYLNGKKVSQSLQLSTNGTYEVNTTYNGKNLSTYIFIPKIFLLRVNLGVVDGYSPNYAYVLIDNIYAFNVTNGTYAYILAGINTLLIKSPEFYENNTKLNINSNASIRINLIPYSAVLSVYLFPANAKLTSNKGNFVFKDGYFIARFEPGNITIKASYQGFQPYEVNISLTPGSKSQIQIVLVPSANESEIEGKVEDGVFKFNVSDVEVNISGIKAYTNGTGYYYIFTNLSNGTVTFYRDIYSPYEYNFSVRKPSIIYLNVDLFPANVSISSLFVPRITNILPFLFSITYVTWNPYKGNDFGAYEILVSKSSNMSDPTEMLITDQDQTSAFILGTIPGHNYYIQEILRLNNGQFYQSNKIVVSYTNPVYLGVNLAILLGILIYIYLAIKIIFRRRKNYSD